MRHSPVRTTQRKSLEQKTYLFKSLQNAINPYLSCLVLTHGSVNHAVECQFFEVCWEAFQGYYMTRYFSTKGAAFLERDRRRLGSGWRGGPSRWPDQEVLLLRVNMMVKWSPDSKKKKKKTVQKKTMHLHKSEKAIIMESGTHETELFV